jgi:hypothetical protein
MNPVLRDSRSKKFPFPAVAPWLLGYLVVQPPCILRQAFRIFAFSPPIFVPRLRHPLSHAPAYSPTMKRSPILADHIRETELIAGLGGARLLQWLDGTLEIRDGTAAEQKELQQWAEIFLNSSPNLRWRTTPDFCHRRG